MTDAAGADAPGSDAVRSAAPDSAALIADEPFDAVVTESTVVHDGAVWDVRRDVVDYNGHDMVREYVDHTGAVAIYAEDDEGRVLVIQQYRHPVRLRDWELPAGLLDVPGEDLLVAAKRELAEEADLTADEWTELVRYNCSPGGSDERLVIYRARGVHPTASPFDRTDEEADIVARWVPRAEVIAGAFAGRLTNSALLMAAFAVDAAERR